MFALNEGFWKIGIQNWNHTVLKTKKISFLNKKRNNLIYLIQDVRNKLSDQNISQRKALFSTNTCPNQ